MSSKSCSSAARDTSNSFRQSFCLLNYYQHTLSHTHRCRLLCLAVYQEPLALVLLYRHYPAMNNLSVISFYRTEPRSWRESNTETDTYHHVMSDQRAKELLQERLRVCGSTGGNLNRGLCMTLHAITRQ